MEQPLSKKIGVERPPEPTEKEMTLAELAEHRRRQRGEISSSESDRLLRQAVGISESLQPPQAPEESPLRHFVSEIREDIKENIGPSERRRRRREEERK